MTLGWNICGTRLPRLLMEALERRRVMTADAFPPIDLMPDGHFALLGGGSVPADVDPSKLAYANRAVIGHAVEGAVATFYGKPPAVDRVYVRFEPSSRVIRWTNATIVDVPGPTFEVHVSRQRFADDVSWVMASVYFIGDDDATTSYLTDNVRFVLGDARLQVDAEGERTESFDDDWEYAGEAIQPGMQFILDAQSVDATEAYASGTLSIDWGDGTRTEGADFAVGENRWPTLGAFLDRGVQLIGLPRFVLVLPTHTYSRAGDYVARYRYELPSPDGPAAVSFERRVRVRPQVAVAAPDPTPSIVEVIAHFNRFPGVISSTEPTRVIGTANFSTSLPRGSLRGRVVWEDGKVDPIEFVDARSYATTGKLDVALKTPRRFVAGRIDGRIEIEFEGRQIVPVYAQDFRLDVVDDGLQVGPSSWNWPVASILSGVVRETGITAFVDPGAPAGSSYKASLRLEDGTVIPTRVEAPKSSGRAIAGFDFGTVYASPVLFTRDGEELGATLTLHRIGGPTVTHTVRLYVSPSSYYVRPITSEEQFPRFVKLIWDPNDGIVRGDRVTRLPVQLAWTGPGAPPDNIEVDIRWGDSNDEIITPASLVNRDDGRFDLVTDRTFATAREYRFSVLARQGSRGLAFVGWASVVVQGAGTSGLQSIDWEYAYEGFIEADFASRGLAFRCNYLFDFTPELGDSFQASVAFDDGSPGRAYVVHDGGYSYSLAIQPYFATTGLKHYTATITRAGETLVVEGTMWANDADYIGGDWESYLAYTPSLVPVPIAPSLAPPVVVVPPSNQDEPPASPHSDPPHVLDARAVPVPAFATPKATAVRTTWLSLVGEALIGALPGDANAPSEEMLEGL